MNAQTQLFCTMLMAMCDDEMWRVSVDNQADALQEEFVWPDECHYEDVTVLEDDMLDREFWSRGQW